MVQRDTITKYILGEYLLEFPSETKKEIAPFSDSQNMWLNRSTILFQWIYKQKTNADFLFSECLKQAHSKEFFIQKAISWVTGICKIKSQSCDSICKKQYIKTIKYKRSVEKYLLKLK